jgi:asparagine synthetase B (glutamine-hydrolysing)
MAVGLEGRVPLLDDALVDLAERTPDDKMMSWRRGKGILRELAVRFRVPTTGMKRGFAVPLATYFAGSWHAEAREWFGSLASDLVDGRVAARLVDHEPPPATDLWMLATLAGWEERLTSARRHRGGELTIPLLASPS